MMILKNTLEKLYKLLIYIIDNSKENYVIILIYISITALITFLLTYHDKKIFIVNFDKGNEYCIFNDKLIAKQWSGAFFESIHIDEKDFFVNFKLKYPTIYDEMVSALEFQGHYSVFLDDLMLHLYCIRQNSFISINIFNCQSNIFENCPIPIRIEGTQYTIENNMMKKFGNIINFNLPISGNFILKDNIIYKKYISKINKDTFMSYIPFLSTEQWQILEKNMNNDNVIENLPISIMALDKNTNFIACSKNFITMFRLKKTPNNLKDFIEVTRGNIFPDSISFNKSKNDFINSITSIDQSYEEKISTLDGRVLALNVIKDNNRIYLTYNDITSLLIDQNKLKLIEDIQNKVLVLASDIIIFFNNSYNVNFSNFALINKNMPIIEVKKILNSFDIHMTKTKEITLIDGTKCMFLKRSSLDKLPSARVLISEYLHKIARIFETLSIEFDPKILEYVKYTKFLLFNIDITLKALEISSIIDLKSSVFNILEVFEQIKDNISEVFIIKNLNITINIDNKDAFVYAPRKSIEFLFEKIFALAFNYQFHDKIISISKKNNDVLIEIKGIPVSESKKIFILFDIINNNSINTNIENNNEILSIKIILKSDNDLHLVSHKLYT